MGNYEYEPIKKLKENNKKKMFFMFLTIFMFLGISLATIYFVYRFNDTRENTITSGLVDIDFKEQSPSIDLQKTVPMADEIGKENEPYIFTVENISKIPLRLKIGIDILNSTIDLSAIRYALYIDNEEIKVDNLGNLDSENNFHIIEQFAPGAKIEVKLVFWIDYYYEKAGGTFSGKIRVEGEQYDIIYEKIVTASDTIKDTVGKEGGITGLDPTTGEVCSNGDCKEYRYSGNEGIKNYIYFNCEAGATEEDASSKCELWRIVGIFKDDSGAEHLKIVRDNVLTADMFPETYTINGTTYNIKYTSGNYAYWNSLNPTTYSEKNDWATVGLQYWLNTEEDETEGETNKGYLSYLKGDTLSMIEETKYYLGTVTYKSEGSNYGIIDTPKEAYTYERAVEGCADGKGPTENSSRTAVEGNTACRVWANNQATWTGKVALLYPSDYGFSTESSNWDSKMYYGSFDKGPSDTSWLQKTANHDDYEWLLSPSSYTSNIVATWNIDGSVRGSYVSDYFAVRPSLNLKSNINITGGDGSKLKPYFVNSGQ